MREDRTTGPILRSASASASAGLLADRLIVNPTVFATATMHLLRAAVAVSDSTGLWVKAITRFPRLATTSCRKRSASIASSLPGRSPAWA
jgi:hypothetical protein